MKVLPESNISHLLMCSGYDPIDVEIIHANGSILYDASGRQYIDFESGVWCTVLGHNHPRINGAIRKQLELISHAGCRYATPVAEEAARALTDVADYGNGKAIFLSSGSEAVEFAVQVVRRITNKPKLITFSDSYLAAYGSAARSEMDEWHCFDWSACRNCTSSACTHDCDAFARIPFRQIGGFVFEPGNSSGTVRFPPNHLVQSIAGEIRSANGILAADEVTTGFGRTGKWFGYEHYAFRPDIIAVGKGLGNGYPVSAVVMRRDVADILASSGFRYAQSHQNDPLGCTVAKEVIQTLRENGLVERSRQVGAGMLQALEMIAAEVKAIREVRGRGMMIAVEFHDDAKGFSLEECFKQLLDAGYVVGCKPSANLLRFYPPLTIAEEAITSLVDKLFAVLRNS